MPLLDHFHPPLSATRHWESFHSSWATRLADALTERWLPPNYIAEEHVHFGPSVEIDVATFEEDAPPTRGRNPNAATGTRVWAPPPPDLELPATFPDAFEVRVLNTEGGPKLVAAIELVSPGNKDRAEARQAFAAKCAGYLSQGISLILVDVVTSRRANLHNEVVQLLRAGREARLPPKVSLYAVAYRPLRRRGKGRVAVWRSPLALGYPLPELPLGLGADLAIPVDLEAAYNEACRRKRLTGS